MEVLLLGQTLMLALPHSCQRVYPRQHLTRTLLKAKLHKFVMQTALVWVLLLALLV